MTREQREEASESLEVGSHRMAAGLTMVSQSLSPRV